MRKNLIAKRAGKDLVRRNYEAFDGLEAYDSPQTTEVTIEIACGAAAGIARLFGSHDPSVLTDNDGNGITITPSGSVDHAYLRSFLASKSARVVLLELSANTAAQVKKPWEFIRRDIAGNQQTQPVAFRTSSNQMQDNKIEKQVNWLLDGECEIKIPMDANGVLTVTLHIAGYEN